VRRPFFRASPVSCDLSTLTASPSQNGDLVLTFRIPSASTYASMKIGSTTVLILDHASAYKVWQPTLATDNGEWSAFAEVGTNSSAVVLGPYLVRNGSVEDGGRLVLFGDTDAQTSATIFAPSSVSSVTWNGADVPFNVTDFGILCVALSPRNLPSVKADLLARALAQGYASRPGDLERNGPGLFRLVVGGLAARSVARL
jgi:hypothetical protein